MKANYLDNSLIQENKKRVKMYEDLAQKKEVENTKDWDIVEPGTDLDMGVTMYDIAKQGAASAPPMSEGALSQMRKDICTFVVNHPDVYYMLLCNERRDYTVLHTYYRSGWDMAIAATIQECLQNRGDIVEYEIQEQAGGIELWVRDNVYGDGDAVAYYFFPYGAAIVEV